MADTDKSEAAKTMQDSNASEKEKSDAAKTMSPNAKGPQQDKKD